jgi:hypothetical protein
VVFSSLAGQLAGGFWVSGIFGHRAHGLAGVSLARGF